MTIQVGDRIPSADLWTKQDGKLIKVSTESIFGGKKVVMFALPGAFTPTCSEKHLPGFIVNADKIKARGVDSIVCLSVNDAHVMEAWSEHQNADELELLADGNVELTRAMGLDADMSAAGFGIRSKRYAMIVNDGLVEFLAVEVPKTFEVSSAEAILKQL